MSLGAAHAFGAILIAAELSVGVAPFSVLGLDPESGEALRRSAQAHLEARSRDRQVLSLAEIDRAVDALGLEGAELHDCLSDGPCAARVARHAGADELLVGSVGGLGATFVLRLSLIHADDGVIARELQQSVSGDEEALAAVIDGQVDQLLPRSRPWYHRWWVWTLIGAAIVGAGVVTAVMLWPDEPNRDTYPLP